MASCFYACFSKNSCQLISFLCMTNACCDHSCLDSDCDKVCSDTVRLGFLDIEYLLFPIVVPRVLPNPPSNLSQDHLILESQQISSQCCRTAFLPSKHVLRYKGQELRRSGQLPVIFASSIRKSRLTERRYPTRPYLLSADIQD